MPPPPDLPPAERAVVRAALHRGCVTREQIEQVYARYGERPGGSPSDLLVLLGVFLTDPAVRAELAEVYRAAQVSAVLEEPTEVESSVRQGFRSWLLDAGSDPAGLTSNLELVRTATVPSPGPSEQPLLRIPKTIGVFEVKEELARGGMGVVYRAYHPKLNRDVAIKLLLAGEWASPRQVERFMVEGRAVARLRHPNIVAVHDLGEEKGFAYLVMDFIKGESLQDRLKREGSLPVREAVRITLEISRALGYAHSCGVLHRDIKPHNVLITESGDPLLVDFGLARETDVAERITTSGVFMGTVGYASPEQVQGQVDKVDGRTDIYALGALLYALLCGRPPCIEDAMSITEFMIATIERRPRPPSRHRREVSAELEAVILRCLEKKPEDRYASAEELVAALATYMDGPTATTGRLRVGLRVAGVVFAVALAFGSMAWSDARRFALVDAERVALADGIDAYHRRRVRFNGLLTEAGRLRDSGKIDEAIAVYDEALRFWPTFPQAWLERGDLHMRHRNDFEAAYRDMTRAIELDPSHPMAWAKRAGANGLRGQWGEAFADLERAIALSPDESRLWLNRGTALRNLDRLLECEKSYTRAIELQPNWATAHIERGQVRLLIDDPDGANADSKQAVKLASSDPKANFLRARILERHGEFASAARFYERVLLLKPRASDAKAGLETTRTMSTLNDRLVKNMSDAQAWYELATLHDRRGNPEAAILCYDKALELQPEFAEGWNNRGTMHLRLKNLISAHRDFNRAVELAPQVPQGWFHRAKVRFELKGQDTEVIADCSRAIALSNDFVHAFYVRAQARERGGDLLGAQLDFQKILEIAPKGDVAALARTRLEALDGE